MDDYELFVYFWETKVTINIINKLSFNDIRNLYFISLY